MLSNPNASLDLTLTLADYNSYGAASIKQTNTGLRLFDFTIGPVSDELAAALADAAEKRKRIRLNCRGGRLFFDVTALERKDSDRVYVAGHVVGVWSAYRP